MGERIYTSKIRIYQDKRPVRRAYIAPFPEPVRYGMHSGLKAVYKMTPEEELPSTLDHLIAAVAG